MNPPFNLQVADDTLLIIPCSKSKQCGSRPCHSASIVSTLDSDLSTALSNARGAIRSKAQINDSTEMPAYLRYTGRLYQHCASAIGRSITLGRRIVILSGGYGVLLSDEPIGTYEKRFAMSDWPDGLLEACLLDYARRNNVQRVIAVMSRTPDYAKLVRRVKWRQAGLAATLICPNASSSGGAQVTAPRAQGQAIDALLSTGIDEGWRSSDQLSLTAYNL